MPEQNVTVNVTVNPYCRPRRPRYQHWWYWLLGVWALELEFWVVAAEVLAAWWLLWATAVAIGGEVGKHRTLPEWWAPAVEQTRPVWPKPATTGVKP